MFKRRGEARAERIDTLIGKATRIEGDLEFAGGLHLDGCVTGSVRAAPGSGSTVAVSEHGRIDGSVEATQVILNGAVRGDIQATGRVVLGPRAWVEGNVVYGSIEMAAGAEVRGMLRPRETPAEASGASASADPVPGGPQPGTSMAQAGTNTVESP